MNVLSLGSDASVFKQNSNFRQRIFDYAKMVEKYVVVVPYEKPETLFLDNNTIVYGSGGGNKICQLVRMYFVAKKAVKEHKIDVITCQDPFEYGFIGWLLSRKFRIGLNIQEHGDFFSENYWRRETPLNYLRYVVGCRLIKKAHSVRVVSERVRRTLIDKLDINGEDIVKVPVYVGALLKENQNFHKDSDLKGKFVFLTMSRLVKQKNLPLLISAFKIIADKHAEAVLMIVGKGNQEGRVKRLVKKLHLGKSVIFRGWTDDPGYYYRQADTYVLSSNYEGWAMVIIEAASYGLPVIMTDVGCAGEVIVDGRNGLVVDTANVEQLVGAMEKVISNPDLRTSLSAEVKKTVNELPGKENILALYMESWLLARKKAANK